MSGPGAGSGLLDLFFPPVCAACGAVLETAVPFCELCAVTLEPPPSPRCARCGEPGDALCPRCEARPPPFDFALAPFLHEGPLARAIHRFKYEDHPELAAPLSQLLAEAARRVHEGFALCAVPLHASRLRQRKYDQAELLTRALAKRLERPRLKTGLTRTKATRRQVGLSEPEREANLEGAFTAPKPVPGARVLLVDDVFTTGATARAASAALKKAGAAEVGVLTLTRATSIG